MADYSTVAKKLAASEERLFGLLDEFKRVRLELRDGGFQDKALAERAEKLFDEGMKEQKVLQALFDKLLEIHKKHWQGEYDRQISLAREALVPLVRAWRIAYRAQGAIAHFPAWVEGKFSGELIAEIEHRIASDEHDLPLDPPKCYALERAENELLTN